MRIASPRALADALRVADSRGKHVLVLSDVAGADWPDERGARCWGATTRYRFRDYAVTVVGPMALPTFEVVCVTGDDQDCGAASGQMHTPEKRTRWIAAFCVQTEHESYEHATRASLRAEPGD